MDRSSLRDILNHFWYKKHRQINGRRILAFLTAIVLSGTTAAMVLPAATAGTEILGGAQTVSGNEGVGVSGGDAGVTSAQTQAAQTGMAGQASMPAQTFEGGAGDIRVLVRAEEGIFPEGTVMRVSPVADEGVLASVRRAAREDLGDAVTESELAAVAVDISFWDGEGREIQPAGELRVMLTADVIAQNSELALVHVDHDGAPVLIEELADSELTEEAAENELVFVADSFSTYALVYRAETRGGSSDLGQYMISVDSYKDVNGSLQKTTEFVAGDKAVFRINYAIPAGTIIPDRTLTYQVSGNIVLPEAGTAGNIYDTKLNAVGTYTITSAGLVTMKFAESFNTSEEFLGYINFSGQVKNDSDTEDVIISFQDGITIIVHPKKQEEDFDLTTAKTGAYDREKGFISYEVRISSSRGTNGRPVTLYDIMHGSGIDTGFRDVFDVSLTDSTGAAMWGYTPADGGDEAYRHIIWTGEGFAIENLPALEKDGSYTLTYKVRIDESGVYSEDGRVRVQNWLKAVSGGKEAWGYSEQYVFTEIVSKSHAPVVVEGENKIRWTIVINKRDGSDYLLKDILTSTGDQNVSLPDSFSLKGPDGTTQTGSFQNGTYTLRGAEGRYEITYLTDAPSGSEGAWVSAVNTAEVTAGGKTYKSTSAYSVTMPVYEYGVTKKAAAQSEAEETAEGARLTWSVEIQVPASGVRTDSMMYTDTLSAVNVSGGNEALVGAHYITAAELNQSLAIRGAGTGELKAGEDYRLYDPEGNDITGSGEETQLGGFQIRFQESLLTRLRDTALKLTYTTLAKYDQSYVGETWSYINQGAIPGHEAQDQYSHTKTGGLDKKASKDGITYTNDNVEVDYTGGRIYYQIQVKMSETGEIRLKDTLPQGLRFIAESLDITYYMYNQDGSWEQALPGDWNGHSSADLKADSLIETEGQTVQVTIPAAYTYASSRMGIRLRYEAGIDDAFWKDKGSLKKIYSNKVEWGELTDKTDTTVVHQEDVISKSASQNVDELTGATRSVDYSLVVNPQALDLIPSTNVITLTDVLTLTGEDSEATLNLASLKVYAYDPAAEGRKGELINAERYSYQVDTEKRSFTLKLPDELAMVVTYTYDITLGLSTPVLSNTAVIAGVGGADAGHSFSLQNASSSAGVIRQRLTVYKVDSENYRVTLPGVSFALKKLTVGTDGKALWQDGGSWVTDQNGAIVYDPALAGAAVERGTLYQLIETDNPIPGYTDISAALPYYFIMNKPGIGNQETYTRSGADKAGIDSKAIRFITHAEALYVPNVNKSLTVQKVWLNADNSDLTEPGVTADVVLYRRRQALKTAVVTIHLKELNSAYPADYGLTEEQKEARRNKAYTVTVPLNGDLTLRMGGAATGDTLYYAGQTYTHQQNGSIPIGRITGDTTVLIEGWSNNPWWAWIDKITLDYVLDGYQEWETVGAPEQVGDKVTLSSDGDWRYTWTDLPDRDGQGSDYYYYVEEMPVSGFTTTYSDNNLTGIQTGTLTITNQKIETSEYVLPRTGGGGWMPYTGGGLILVLTALFLYTIQKKKEKA